MISTLKLFSLIFFAVGIFVLMQVIFPAVSFKLWELSLSRSNQLLISPEASDSRILGVSYDRKVFLQDKRSFPAIVSLLKRKSMPPFTQFSLSIPAINMEAAPVLIDSNDFSQKLAHLPGSALPGEKGNVFITGHSAGNFILNKKQEDYFAKLPNLKKGDQIHVFAGGSQFKYEVIQLKIVSPSDLSVIYPRDEMERYISLMTCVPPGINTKRLVVIGKMI